MAERTRLSFELVFAGMVSVLVGIGLARFAYTPLIPALIEAGWFSESAAAYLGAANLLGYFAGAVSAHAMSERLGTGRYVRVALLAVVLSLVLCAWPAPFAWFFVWRVVAGIAGAGLMVVGPSTVLVATPPERRAAAGALVFAGLGLGILLSATIVPNLLSRGLTATWLVLAAAALVLTVASWPAWRRSAAQARGAPGGTGGERPSPVPLAVLPVLLAYSTDAIGFVPHTVFWADFLARERELGVDAAGLQWGLFGVGAAAGALLAGRLAAWLGWNRGLAAGLGVKSLAVSLPLFSQSWAATTASSLVVGALTPGMVVLASGRLAELVGPHRQKRVWGWATASFAAFQATAGYTLAWLFSVWGSYLPLYRIAALALAAGVVLAVVAGGMGGRELRFGRGE